MTIQPIQTAYHGCLFRSRLEARWAVFFDTLQIPWEYEPEGFQTSAGPYLPDFRIQFRRHVWTWFEVKSDMAPPADPRHRAFADAGEYLTVARGLPESFADQFIPRQPKLITLDPPPRGGWQQVGWECWKFDSHLGLTSITAAQYEQIPLRQLPRRGARINQAYRAARSARFEHGQVGAML
jgi:hypothetical protein